MNEEYNTVKILSPKGGRGYDIMFKRDVTAYPIEALLLRNDDPVDLTGCRVEFSMRHLTTGRFTLRREAAIQDAAAGEVRFDWQPGDTDVAGSYRAEFKVTYPDGRRATFPNAGYIKIFLMKDIE